MSLEPVLIAGVWRQARNPLGAFGPANPATKAALPERYPVSGEDDIEEALRAARGARLRPAAARRRRPVPGAVRRPD